MTTADRTPPNSRDEEVSVLGAILREPMAAHEVVASGLRPEDFYHRRHQLIFGAMLELYRDGKSPDAVLTAEELRRRGELDEAGGTETLIGLWDQVVTAANIQHYVRAVRDAAMLRGLIAACRRGEEAGFAAEGRPAEVVDRVSHEVYRLAIERAEGRIEPMSGLVRSVMEDLDERIAASGRPPGLATPWEELDDLTNGFQPGQLIIVAARPGVGKSSAAANLAVHSALVSGVPVLIFSLETERKQVAMNMLCGLAQVEIYDVARGWVANDEKALDRLNEQAARLARAKIFIDDTAVLDGLQFRAKTRHMVQREKVGLVIVDYLQLMKGPAGSENKQQELEEISKTLKAVARDMKMPVVALAQLNRAVESREKPKPRLSDLRGSGSIEQDADVVIMLYRPDYYEDKADDYDPRADVSATAIVAKNRIGRTGEVELTFQRRWLRFVGRQAATSGTTEDSRYGKD